MPFSDLLEHVRCSAPQNPFVLSAADVMHSRQTQLNHEFGTEQATWKRQKYVHLHGSKFDLQDEEEAEKENREQLEDCEILHFQEQTKKEGEQEMIKEQEWDDKHMAVMASTQELSNTAQMQATELKRLQHLVSNPAFYNAAFYNPVFSARHK